MSHSEATAGATRATNAAAPRAFGTALVASLALEAAAVALLLITGAGRSGGSGIGSVLTPVVLFAALVPAPALQLVLALMGRPGDRGVAPTDPSVPAWRRLVTGRYGGVVVAFVGGLWLLLAAVVSLATAGGVVWL